MKKMCITLAALAVFTATCLTSCGGNDNNGNGDGEVTVGIGTGMVSDVLDGSMENRNMR